MNQIMLVKARETPWVRFIITKNGNYQKEDMVHRGRINEEGLWHVLAWVISGWHFD